MAATSVILDIRANTNRALNEFKKFSAQLDNKFLVSGLKLDVVRSALGQINREFQRAIGEQGLASGQSLRAAQNQAALILNTFKNVGLESSIAITEQFSTAFSDIAIKAGGSAEDIKKALGASSWISTNLSEDVRKQLAQGVAEFQIFARQAGLGNNYAEIIQQFLAGQVTARQLINSGKPLESTIGVSLSQASGGNIDEIVNAEQRSRIVQQLQNSSQLRTTLQQMIARADWGFTIIEQLNARLFNPERGVFGVLRQVTMAVGDKTSILRETRKLIESIFGQQGLFVNFFKQIGKIFGLEDPLKVVITGVRFLTSQFKKLNEFVQSTEFQTIVGLVQSSFNIIKDFVTKLYNSITTDLQNPDSIIGQIRGAGDSIFKFFESILSTIEGGNWDPSNIISSIQEIGNKIRGFIESIGESIRESDVTKQGEFFLGIFKTVIGEVAQTLGTVIKEAIGIVFSAKGAAVLGGAIQVFASAIGGLFKGLFTNANFIQSLFGGAALLTVGAIFAKRITSGLLRLADRFIRALPGGDRLSGLIRGRLSGRFGSLENRGLASDLGSTQSFHRQVIFYLSRIADCVCGRGFGGGGRDIDIDADTPEARRERVRTRRGPKGRGIPKRAPLTSIDTINPGAYPTGANQPFLPDTRLSFLKARREARRNYVKGLDSSKYFDIYTESLGGSRAAPFADESRELRRARAWSALRGIPGEAEYQERLDRRYKRRFGVRGKIKRSTRGLRRFGKGALIGTAIASLIGIGAGVNANEIDPITGEPVDGQASDDASTQIGQEIFGFAGGAAGGALGTAIAGPIGGIIGATLGDMAGRALASMPFMKPITKALGGWAENAVKAAGKLWEGTKKAFDGIRNFFSDIFTQTGRVSSTSRSGSANRRGSLARREVGGPVIRGVPYEVGERGTEVFIPNQSGTILSNRELRSLKRNSSSSTSVYANFDVDINVNGAIGMNNIEELRAPIIAIINQAWSEATVGVTTRGSVV